MMRPLVYCFFASVALNVTAMMSVDRAFLYEGRKLEMLTEQRRLRAEQDKLPFEFIETPRTEAPKKPISAQKISDRDSVARDQSRHPLTGSAPHIQKPGPADQLAQERAKPSSSPIAPAKPQEEMHKAVAAEASAAKKTPPDTKGASSAKDQEVRLPSPAKQPASADQRRSSARKAQAGMQQPSGIDKISTQAMARTHSRGASLSGATSFDAMGSDMGVYMKNLKEKIWLAWFPYLAFQYPSDFHAADATISLTLDAKGDVKIVKLIDSYGSPVFAAFCTEAVQRASGFGPIPKEILDLLGKDELEIKFAFHYR